MRSSTVFSTGWGAGYGFITAVVRSSDYIFIDQLSHASLLEGARNATKNVHTFPHLSVTGLERRLKRIRADNANVGILVIAESLFSLNSDPPDLAAHQELARKYKATLMVDAAHDLGCMGASGGEVIEQQGMVGKLDVVMRSFSKTFASNGGFVATNHPALKLALRAACGPHTFSNAISPVQASVVIAAVDIICSSEGKELRKKMLYNSNFLRQKLVSNGFEVLGDPSPIVSTVLGHSRRARLTTRHLFENGAIVNIVEYPAVARNAARYRLQVMSVHTELQLERFVDLLIIAAKSADSEASALLPAEQENCS